MRRRTIRVKSSGDTVLVSPEREFSEYTRETTGAETGRLLLDAFDPATGAPYTRVTLHRGAVERLRDALTEWLEEGGK